MRNAVLMGALVLTGAAAEAKTPLVATDIPPVYGLVAQVMAGVGEPELVVPPGASPHGYALRPSEARALADADLVVWVGEALTPWLEQPIETLASGAETLELLDVEGTTLLALRSSATFEPHHHDGDEETHDDHSEAHDDASHHEADHHEETHHQDHEDHEDHEYADHHDHDAAHHDDHGDFDPHAWLDPANAVVWLDEIAAELADLDPENAQTYRSNADRAKAEINEAVEAAQATLTPLAGRAFVVFHDAYHYFEARFGIEAAGALSLSDAADPGPARVAEVQKMISDLNVICVFAEPQFNPRLLAIATEGSAAKSALLDPLGSELPLDTGFYPALITDLTRSMASCLE